MDAFTPQNRLRGSLPKIGIRPTIDGRYGGVRESLEAQVLAMAQATAKFVSATVRHTNGQPVECVVPKSCIGGFAEAADCADLFAREGVGVSITVTPCWCYGAETIDTDPLMPKAIWGFNGTERPGAVYLAAAMAAHAQKGLPAFAIYGQDVQDVGDLTIPKDVRSKLQTFAQAGLAVASMRGKAYLGMGGVSMGIAGSIVDHDLIQAYFGMRAETVDMTEFVRRMQRGIFDLNEFQRALGWVKANCHEGRDPNPPSHQRTREQKDADWSTSVLMALIARDLMVGNPALEELGFKEEAQGHNAIAAGFQGQRQWTDQLPNGDFLEAILNTSFDWNGVREPFIVATENDALNGLTMLMGFMLTGSAQLFSDVRTYWGAESVHRVTGVHLSGLAEHGVLHLINSGPSALDWTGESMEGHQHSIKPWWTVTQADADACSAATLWCPSITEYFPGGGWSTDFETRGGIPVTMSRLNLVRGLGPVLQIAEGWTVELPEDVHQVLDERTNPTWPTTWFAPRLTGSGAFTDVYSVMARWGANHGAISCGHNGSKLIALASMLRIPVDMHNVRPEDVFRPASWARFGTSDAEGADFRACAAYGPLYA